MEKPNGRRLRRSPPLVPVSDECEPTVLPLQAEGGENSSLRKPAFGGNLVAAIVLPPAIESGPAGPGREKFGS